MKKVNLRFAGFIPVLAIILILSSCVPQKRIKYLQNELEEDDTIA